MPANVIFFLAEMIIHFVCVYAYLFLPLIRFPDMPDDHKILSQSRATTLISFTSNTGFANPSLLTLIIALASSRSVQMYRGARALMMGANQEKYL